MPPPKKSDLPSTLLRSAEKIQRTYLKSLESAEETYDSAERANRTAWSAVKQVAEKTGDHWELKDEPGRSEPEPAANVDSPDRPTSGGVDATASKAELYEKAKAADIDGRSKMTKEQLVEALARFNDRETARARRG